MAERVAPSTSEGLRGSSGTHGPLDVTAPGGGADDLTGWVRFGAVMMTIVGAFGVIEGLTALLDPTTS